MNKKILIGIIIVFILVIAGGYYFLAQKFPPKQEKRFSGINVIFFPGGAIGDSFATIVYNGAKAAQEDLGANVEYKWSDWDPNKMIEQFKEAIDEKPDAICMMGHPGAEVLGPLINEAERKGIIVTLQNVDLPTVRAQYSAQGMGYAGQNVYASGLALAQGAARKYGLKSGDQALVFGLLSEVGRGDRTKGCVDGFKQAGVTVNYKEITDDVNKSPDSDVAKNFFADALKEFPETKIILIDHGSLTAASPNILKELGKKPGEILVAGFDLSASTVKGIQDGYIGLVSDQQPFLQGYLPILQVVMAKKYNFAGLDIDTGVGLIDSTNVEAVSKLAAEGIR